MNASGGDEMHDDALLRLAGLARPEGGWAYTPSQPPHLEPTCLALLALAAQPERHQAAIAAGKAWLQTAAAGDGTYRLGRGRPEAVWPTALVLSRCHGEKVGSTALEVANR